MKFCLKLLLIFTVALLWNACSDSSGSGETIEMTVAANVEVVKDKKSLPSCTSDLQGQEYYVTSENAIYACIDKAWVMTSKVKEWETYASMVCTTKPLKDNSGVQVLCGDSLVAKIYNGKKGKTGVKGEKGEVGENGADGADGARGDQGDKGEPGEKGVAGKDGENGTNGKKGAPGEDCSVETLLEDDSTGVPVPRGLTITCGSTVRDIYNGSDGVDGEDGSNGENGEPGSDCYVREIDGGIEQYCDGNFVNTVYNGRTGENGSNGDDGTSCHLETMEVMGLRVICGEDSIGTLFSAISGVNGKNGIDGTSCYAVENEDGSGYTIICGGNFATEGYEKDSWQFLNPDVEYGTFVDSRDNQIYKMVKIGSQVWMAENLNYADSVNYPSMKKRSRCYVDNADSCAKYGRYYSWAAAMDSLNTGCGYGKNCSPTYPVQGVCPNGWHLPTKAEYETLVEAVDGRGNMLKSMNAGWPEASDDYGFSVTPTSGFDVTGEPHPDYWGVDANVWSATQSSKTGAYYLYFVDYRNAAELWDGDGEKNIARSVRCLKDDSQMTTVVQLTNGKNGKNGTNGIDGKNCSIEKNDNGYTFACGGDYVGTVTEKPSWQFLNPDYEYAMFVDGRDNQVYKATKIGSQVWMAENLNYADSVNYPSMKKRSRCYADKVDSCAKYGRYYTWSAAMDSLNTGCGFGKKCSPTYPVQGVCPNGWHLPAKAEYETLIEFVDGHGNRLKSKNAGWPEASDDYGFSVAPTGTASMNGGFNYFGTDVNMNTASPSSEPGPYFLYLVDYRNVVEIWDGYDEDYEKDIARPVRCLKDDSSMETMYQMTNGSDGKDGKNGTDGKNCSVNKNGYGYAITCGGDYVGPVTEKPSWQFLNPDYEYAMFVDVRDNQVYKATKIGSQVWMAENLNYADSVAMPSLKGNTACYPDNKPESCKTYGRHYSWAAAMDSVNTGCGYGTKCLSEYPIQGACPSGWHVPTNDEWNTLIDFVGDDAGTKLKSALFNDGSNIYGFSAFAAGNWDGSNFSSDATEYADIWTSTPYSSKSGSAYYRYFSGSDVGLQDRSKLGGISLRCLKDDSSMETMYQMTNGSDGKNGSSCVTEPTADGSKLKVMCPKESGGVIVYDSVGVITNAAEGTYCAMIPLVEGSKDSRLVCGLKKGDVKPKAYYGTLVDERDGKVYKTLVVGSQTWMAENLNYDDSVKTKSLKGNSWCYDNSTANCDKYGRLYSWAASIDSVALYNEGDGVDCGNGKYCKQLPTKRGICPEGWHLPDTTEWRKLYANLGNSPYAMQEKGYYYWGNATNMSGFSALPAGWYAANNSGGRLGERTYYWSINDNSSTNAYIWLLHGSDSYLTTNPKNQGLSVRCVMD